MLPTRSRPRRAIRVLLYVLITATALAIVVGGLVVVSYELLVAHPSCAKPPTQQERHQHEAFVLAHLPDARGFEWIIADCDNGDDSSFEFATRQRGSSASQAFLSDPACKASTKSDASPGDVTCTSGAVKVLISFEDTGAIDTDCQLAIERH